MRIVRITHVRIVWQRQTNVGVIPGMLTRTRTRTARLARRGRRYGRRRVRSESCVATRFKNLVYVSVPYTRHTAEQSNMEQGLEADHHQATHFYHKSTGLRAVVGLTSALSIVGSLLIVLSYICFRDLRTKAREILTHISLMDLGVAVSNLVGIGVNFSHYYDDACHHKYNSAHHECNVSSLIDTLCVVQGAFATGFTIGSVLWTVCLAMYMYLLISLKGTREAKLFVKAAYVFCYLMPVGITVWLALTKRIGFSPYESSAWCGALFVLPHKKSDILAATFGYNLWIFLTFVLIPVLYISSHMYIRDEVNKTDAIYQSVKNTHVNTHVYIFIFHSHLEIVPHLYR